MHKIHSNIRFFKGYNKSIEKPIIRLRLPIIPVSKGTYRLIKEEKNKF